MNVNLYTLSLRVLIYKEAGQFVAHALEADALGYGDTPEKAAQELKSLLDVHMIFATSKGHPDMVFSRAPQEFFDRWEEAHEAQLRGEEISVKSWRLRGKALVFGIEENSGKSGRSRKEISFSPIEEPAFA